MNAKVNKFRTSVEIIATKDWYDKVLCTIDEEHHNLITHCKKYGYASADLKYLSELTTKGLEYRTILRTLQWVCLERGEL